MLSDQSVITPHSFHNLHYPRKSAEKPDHTLVFITYTSDQIVGHTQHKAPGFQSYRRIVGTHSI